VSGVVHAVVFVLHILTVTSRFFTHRVCSRHPLHSPAPVLDLTPIQLTREQWMDVKLECPTCRQQLPDSLSQEEE
jgi:hypothetical protein